jgi:hypothetical protein
VPDLDALRRLAPPVAPAPPELVARARARVLRPHRRRRRPALLLAPVAAAAALALGLTQLGGGGQTFAAELVRAAQASPRLLMDGWSVTRVDEWSAGEGEMTFASGSRTLALSWWTAAGTTPGKDSDDLRLHATVAGAPATVYRYRGTSDYTAFWTAGGATVEARALAPTPDDFLALLARLRRADAEAWLRALPASAVQPDAHADTVAAMLKGLPLPPGFDAGALADGARTRDRYQLGAQVAGAVACGWIADWLHGPDRARAVRALATARDWPILDELTAQGDYPRVLWQYADAIVHGDGTVVGGKRVTVAESYESALGCPA